jgi:Topoisomerase 6 subunit A/Spo11, Toprim domain
MGRKSASLSKTETAALLEKARAQSKPVKPQRLGFVGRLEAYPGYARTKGIIHVGPSGSTKAALPFTLEAWARPVKKPRITLCVNRSPITAELDLFRPKGHHSEYALVGCQLSHTFRAAQARDFSFLVNLQCPHVPITTDGKSPDLNFFCGPLLETLTRVAARAQRASRRSGPSVGKQKHMIYNALPSAIHHASGANQYRFSQRQLFYAVRPLLQEAFDIDPDYNWFCKVLTSYENDYGEIEKLYRDARGTLHHPHTHEEISLGTREVEAYRRPEWTFNKILYCEKEGFFPILQDADWPERHDCALLTSKGFATRAARDVLDHLGASKEALRFFCVHDADGPGTMIYQALQQATDARPGRKVEIVNLGLEPKEALQMGLTVERVARKDGRAVPVANYVSENWRKWLQSQRVELNAMSTPQFLAWLDRKILLYYSGKLLPPQAVLTEHLKREARERSFDETRARILREQRFEEQADRDFRRLSPAMQKAARKLRTRVKQFLKDTPIAWWPKAVTEAAEKLVNGTSV